MSEIGFTITRSSNVTPEEVHALRRHYLTYVRSEQEQGRNLHEDLDAIYSKVDGLMNTEDFKELVRQLHDCEHIIVFATESSTLVLREFQQAMLAEGKTVRLVSEVHSDINSIRALLPKDLLIVVTTSNGFARRQHERIAISAAHKVIVTASEDTTLHAAYESVFAIGEGAQEGAAPHRIYATYGVTYFFDRLFASYAQKYDPALA